MRIMLDTNIIVSMLIFDNVDFKMLLVKIYDEHKLILSSYI